MAAVLKLRRDSTDLSFLNSSGLYLREQGWKPQVATPVYGRRPSVVEEVLDMDVIGSSHDNVGATMQALDQMRRLADEYMRDRTQEHPVWLHAKLDGETGERRALARRVGVQWLSEHYSGEMVGYHPAVRVAIERGGVWERMATYDLPHVTPSAAASLLYDYTAAGHASGAQDVVGDVGARISQMIISPYGSGDELGRLWIGIRSANKHGTVTNFHNIWELEDTDTTLGTDAARATDATASPGGAGNTKVTITPGTATWAKRLTIELGDVITSNYADQYGDFQWLLRQKVSAGKWEVQLRWGYTGMADADFREGDIREVSSTAWDYEEMDPSAIPLYGRQVFASFAAVNVAALACQVWARRVSGSGTLDLDCLCPIPVDEGFLKTWGFTLTGTGSVTLNQRWYYERNAKQVEAGVLTTSVAPGNTIGFAPLATSQFRLPPGDGRMVIVYAREASSDLTDTLVINPIDAGKYYPRWLALRGAE